MFGQVDDKVDQVKNQVGQVQGQGLDNIDQSTQELIDVKYDYLVIFNLMQPLSLFKYLIKHSTLQ